MPSNPPHHRSGAALYYIVSGNGRQHHRRRDQDKGSRFSVLRAVRPRASVGKPRRRAFDLPGFQHQSGRCRRRPSRRACESKIAEEVGSNQPMKWSCQLPPTCTLTCVQSSRRFSGIRHHHFIVSVTEPGYIAGEAGRTLRRWRARNEGKCSRLEARTVGPTTSPTGTGTAKALGWWDDPPTKSRS